MKRLISKLSLLFLLVIFWSSPLTSSNYYDTETSSGNIITAGFWDATPPAISNVSHLLATPEESNDTKAIISWDTDEVADSVLYWTTDNITWETASDASYKTSHSLEILGLLTDVTYSYYVTSSDQSGNVSTSNTSNFSTDGMSPEDFTPTSDIVINEFLINPIGADDALIPGGEWIELYNNSTTDSYDLTGWSIGAYTSSYKLHLTTTNTTSSDSSTSGLVIGPLEFFVIYRNGNGSFYLRNTADDGIRLFDTLDIVVDEYMYAASQVIENKSIARYPDGSSTWFDPIPSPLGANILEKWQSKQPEIKYIFNSQKLSFEVINIEKFKQLEYQLTYNSDSGEQGVIGTNELNNQSSYKKDEIIFGTCSTGGTCVYHPNLSNILLKITLTNGLEVVNLEKIIN